MIFRFIFVGIGVWRVAAQARGSALVFAADAGHAAVVSALLSARASAGGATAVCCVAAAVVWCTRVSV